MPRQLPPPASRPVAWALLSQALWLPLLAVDLQDRWASRLETLSPRPGREAASLPLLAPAPPAGGASLAPARPPSASGLTTPGLLLGSSPLGRAPGAITDAFAATPHATASAGDTAQRGQEAPGSATTTTLALLPEPATRATLPTAAGGFSRAEMLGGAITLADLQEGAMPPMALAERGRLNLSGDPLAALPEAWREPMRRALSSLPIPSGQQPRLNQARHVHVPSSRISRPTEVPLALQSDGSVDILSRPDTDAVVDEIRDWSARQTPPSAGTVAPALVHLHPVSPVEPLRPSATDLTEAPPASVPVSTAPSSTPAPAQPQAASGTATSER